MGEFSGPYFEDELTTDKPADAGESDLRIFQVSTHGKSGALPWHNPVGVICVAYAKEAK
jgi:hypothetical protein